FPDHDDYSSHSARQTDKRRTQTLSTEAVVTIAMSQWIGVRAMGWARACTYPIPYFGNANVSTNTKYT
ncbi:MAG: hypothetical protein ABJQ14_13360, partial [Hyphomicrobiales bacterium]